MKVLHIDCSIRNEWSVSKTLSGAFVNLLAEEFGDVDIDYLDIAKDTPAHPSALMIRANYTAPVERTMEMVESLKASDRLVDKMINSHIYVIGMPMYNFSVPSNFKAFIDNVVRIGRTFQLSGHGTEGLLKNKRAYIINTRGADFSPEHMQGMDQLVPYIKVIFGFMGVNDIEFINVHPVQFAMPEERENAIERAKTEIFTAVNHLKESTWKLN